MGIKRIDIDLASNQFPKCSPQPEIPKRFTELGREEKGRVVGPGGAEIVVIWGRKWRVKRGRGQSSQ